MPDDERKLKAPGESGLFRTSEEGPNPSLLERAQRKARLSAAELTDERSASSEAMQRLIHDLRVHQIELELQKDELLRSQEELEVSRARYFDLYDLAPVGYVTLAETGLVLEANLTAATLLNVERLALVKRPWTSFVHSGSQDVYFMYRKQLFLKGGPLGCELQLLKSGGEAFWAQLEARISAGEGGRVAHVTVSDVSERKRATEVLQASEARHRALFESSPAALMTFAPPSWRFMSANAAALALFGAEDEAALLSRTLWDLSPVRQPDGRLSADQGASLLALVQADGGHSVEWTCLRLPAEEFSATIDLSHVHSSDPPLFQAMVRDESQLQRARANAAQTERLATMGLLAASVGHEINNPLAYVLSNVESLAESLPKVSIAAEHWRAALRRAVGGVASHPAAAALGESESAAFDPTVLRAAAEQARQALDGVQRIRRISTVLSAFSRSDAPALAPVDVNAALESAITLAFNEFRFETKLLRNFEAVPPVRASEGKLAQVFLNLLVNAAHATHENGAEDNSITVRTWTQNGDVFAEVSDTGPGIAPENLDRVFEPFFSTKGIGKGSGLGLSICRNIISELGGDIRVESEIGHGARFIVRLPVSEHDTEVEPPAPEQVACEPATIRGRVLLIDDEEVLRVVMKRLLFEHEVVTAASGRQAKSILESDQNFDLILCDLMMPEVSGMDVHRWLVENHPALAKRVVFVTGGAFGQAAAEYLNAVGNIKIEKPFDNRDFTHVVSDRVRVARSEPPAPLAIATRK